MKKIITPILVTLILALLITACAPRNITPSAAISATPATAVPSATKVVSTATEIPEITADPATLKGLQIQFMHPWSGKTAEEMAKLTDEFNQTNDWGIHVIVQEPGSSGQVASELASDIAPATSPLLLRPGGCTPQTGPGGKSD